MIYRTIAVALGLVSLATLSKADVLDRYVAASQAQAAKMQAFYISRVPEMADALPSLDWSPELQDVASCTLEGLSAANGDDWVETYVAAMEAWAQIDITSMTDMANGMDPILSEPIAMTLFDDCGGTAIVSAQMAESGMMEMMSKPDVMERLMAE